MSSEEEKLHEFLLEIQLDQFYDSIVRKLHVTRVSHFEHVEDTDLIEIGMSKPEQRRLFGHLKKSKRQSFKSFFKKSIKKDSDRGRQSASPPKDLNIECQQPLDANNPLLVARNNIQQGLKCLIQQKDLVLGDFLGKGAFGYVKKGVWTSDKGLKVNVAVKCLKPNHDEATVLLQGEFIKEANAMSKLDHPNLIRLYGIVLTTPMMLVTELAPVGSLLARLRKEPEKFMISILCSFVVQIVSGMKYLEVNRFIHRDLAARNILLVSYEKIKIGDFGLMRALPSDADYYVMHPKGLVPFAWCATECLKYRRFSHASDVWAFGVTLIELFSYGQEPWPGLNGAEILERIDAPNFLRPERPDHCPVEIYRITKSHCWCDNPEERASFEALEKMFLQVLPKETHATFDHHTDVPGQISFQNGDLLTIIESSHAGSFVKAQNRKSGSVGYIPVDLFSSASTGNKIGYIIPNKCHRSLSKSKSGKETLSVRGRLLESDSFSVASRGSSSSSGSNSSSEVTAKHLQNVIHSKPKDIPFKRQSTFSSGVGSSGPSCASSFKDESAIRGVSESDYGSQEDSSSLFSRRSETRISVDDKSLGSYANTTGMRGEPISYENVVLDSGSPPVLHSRPISIPNRDIDRPSTAGASRMCSHPVNESPPITCAAQMLSLPCHTYEADASSNDSALSAETALSGILSNSAPTTRNEMKAIRSTLRKQTSEVEDEFSRKSSFGSYKQRKSVTRGEGISSQFADNLIYEYMKPEDTAEEQYETMEERSAAFDSGNIEHDAYENFEVRHIKSTSIKNQSRELCYENLPLRQQTAEIDIGPILPKKTYRSLDSSVPVPPRTYRRTMESVVTQRLSNLRKESYENTPITIPERTYRKDSGDVPTVVLPPRTYRQGSVEQYENTDLSRTCRSSASSSYENADFSRSSITAPSDSSYENYDLNTLFRTSPDTSYENNDIRASLDTPPPLPKKKSSRTESECSSSVDDGEMRASSRIGVEEAIVELADTELNKDSKDCGASRTMQVPTEVCDSPNCNLIDDSPIHKKLQNKYVTIWDGQEHTKEDYDNSEPVKSSNNEVATAELVPVSEGHGSGQSQDCQEAEKNRSLLNALLSPQRQRSPKFGRAQSEDTPVPPPRKNREKSARRHTTGAMSLAKEPKTAEKLQDEDSESKPYDPALSNGTNTSESTVASSCSIDENTKAPPLPPRIPSEMQLQREDSDYVNIDVEDVIGIETDETEPGRSTEDEQKPHECGVVYECASTISSDLVCDSGASTSEKNSLVEKEKGGRTKPSTGKTKLQKIKSLLSGKVSAQDDSKTRSGASSSSQCGSEASTINTNSEDDDDEEKMRYVLHFVTPV